MSIIYPNQEAKYKGAVLATRERNYYDDSDYYAIVWDEGQKIVREVEYDTTRFAGGGTASVDATPEVIAKARAYLIPILIERVLLDAAEKREQAINQFRQIRHGIVARVTRTIKSRKQGLIEKGFTGRIVWAGYSSEYAKGWGRNPPDRFGVKDDASGRCVFVNRPDLEYAGPEPTDADLPEVMSMEQAAALVTGKVEQAEGRGLGYLYAALNSHGLAVV